MDIGGALLDPLESLSHFWLSFPSFCALSFPAAAPVTHCGLSSGPRRNLSYCLVLKQDTL